MRGFSVQGGNLSNLMSDNTSRPTDTEARIVALEYLVKHLLWNLVVLRVDQDSGDNQDALEEINAFLRDTVGELQGATFPGLDPAGSDHMAALVRDPVQRVVRDLAEEIAKELGPVRPSPKGDG